MHDNLTLQDTNLKTVGHQPHTAGHQPHTAGHQPHTAGHQPSLTFHMNRPCDNHTLLRISNFSFKTLFQPDHLVLSINPFS